MTTQKSTTGANDGTTWADLSHIIESGHQLMLQASGITPAVAEARGYRSVYGNRAVLKAAGFPNGPTDGLLIPQYSCTGEIRYHQFRPDTPEPDPRTPGKFRKYLNPTGITKGLDIHPLIRERLNDIRTPLWLSEGSKKTDALVSAGQCAIGLPDVNGAGLMVDHPEGLVDRFGRPVKVFKPHSDWDQIPLDGRLTYIVFDSDVMTKQAVFSALRKAFDFLTNRGTRVQLVYLPDLPDGSKQGVDDFLGAGGTVRQLRSWYATSELRKPEGKTALPRIEFLSLDAVIERPGQQAVITDWIYERKTALLAAPPSSFKTILALSMALCIVAGLPWHGYQVQQGNVLYMAAEGIDGIGKRARAWAQANNRNLAGLPLQFIEKPVSLFDPAAVDVLEEAMVNHADRYAAIFVDTLARNSVGAEENSNSDMTAVVNAMQRLANTTGAAVMAIHHVARATGRSRGASALPANVDHAFSIELDETGHVLQLISDKQRDLSTDARLTLEREIVTLPDGETSVVLRRLQGDAFVSARRTGRRGEPAYMKSWHVLVDLCGGAPHEAFREDWEQACIDRLHIVAKTFEAHRADLVRHNLVQVRPEGRKRLYRPVRDKFGEMVG